VARQTDNNQREQAEAAAAKLLQTTEGQTLMAFLRQQTIDRPNFPAQSQDGQQMAMYMAFQEGEKNLYREIEQLIRKGRGDE